MPLAESIDIHEAVDREKIKQEVFDIFSARGIKTPAELDFFFTEFLNITIPKKRVCSNHLSPFEIICDIYLNKPPISLWISSRGSGKTYLLSSLDAAHLITKPNFSIIHSAAVQDQTNRAYEYFLQTHKDVNIRNALDGDPTRSKTKSKNNSELSLITMTWQGTNCIRGNVLIDVPRDLSKYPDGIPFIELKRQFDKGKEQHAYGWDEKNDCFILSKIKNIWCSGIKSIWRLNYSWHENGKKYRGHIDSTSDHPYLLLSNDWKALKDLKKGDRLRTRRANNNVVHNHVVESIECLNIEEKVYDMEIEGSFVANGLVVHNSPHVPLLVVDEVELIRDWSILQEALCIPQSKNGYRAQTVMMSTRKWNNGIVQRIVDEAEDRKIKIYESCIFEVLEKCNRLCQNDSKFGNCAAYKVCKGKAHECEGFYTIDDFIEKTLQLDEETIDAQYCCNKPVGYKGASVYEMYKNVHIVNWDYFKRVTGYGRPPDEWKRIGGVDFESVFVYVVAAIEPMTGRKWVYAEHYHDANKKGMLILDEHVGRIQNLEGWNSRVKSWADPSAKQEIYELKRRGVPCIKSPKMAIRTGVDLVRSHLKINEILGTPMLMFIGEETSQTIESMQGWGFHRNDDGTIDYDNYSDEDDHGADAVRYMLYGYHTKPFSKPGRVRGLY